MNINELYQSKQIIDDITDKRLRHWLLSLWDKSDAFYIKYIHDDLINHNLTRSDLIKLYFRYKGGQSLE